MNKIKTCTKQPNNRNNEVERTHLSLTKFLQLLNLAIFAISLQPPRSTSSSVVTLSRPQPSPPWKSQIAPRRTQEGADGAKAPPEIKKKIFTHLYGAFYYVLQFVQRSQFHNHFITIVFID